MRRHLGLNPGLPFGYTNVLSRCRESVVGRNINSAVHRDYRTSPQVRGLGLGLGRCLLHHSISQGSSRLSSGLFRPFHISSISHYQASEDLDMDHYHKVADTTLNALSDSLEAIFENPDIVKDFFDDGPDLEFSSGVMTIRMGNDRGTYVINKQPPNKQIWLSSPLR